MNARKSLAIDLTNNSLIADPTLHEDILQSDIDMPQEMNETTQIDMLPFRLSIFIAMMKCDKYLNTWTGIPSFQV